MSRRRLFHRFAALSLLTAALAIAVLSAWWAVAAYAGGQRDIADKRAQLLALRDLADARQAFARLSPHGKAPALILPADADGESALSTAIAHAADGQQVIVDGVEPLSTTPEMRTATVHLRGTQAGLYAFLRAIEGQVPYLVVPRLEITPSRAADPEHGKPLVLAADLRIALLTAPPTKAHKAVPRGEAGL